jgi:hypothetical protein
LQSLKLAKIATLRDAPSNGIDVIVTVTEVIAPMAPSAMGAAVAAAGHSAGGSSAPAGAPGAFCANAPAHPPRLVVRDVPFVNGDVGATVVVNCHWEKVGEAFRLLSFESLGLFLHAHSVARHLSFYRIAHSLLLKLINPPFFLHSVPHASPPRHRYPREANCVGCRVSRGDD